MQSDISLSLCICTRHRPDHLRLCLNSVFSGIRIPDQVIVSDDGDEGKTVAEVVAEYPPVLYQRGPHMGLGPNRNACIASATSQYICFIDDDVTISETFVDEAFNVCRKHAADLPQRIVTGIEFTHTPTSKIRVEPGNADFWGFQRMRPNGKYRSLVINATVFPAELFRSALFDPQLRYGSDEIDIARHATSLGYTIVFEPSLQVDHYPSQVNRTENARLIDASRLYSTAKDYWCYQRNPVKAITFALVAPWKLAISLGRRSGVQGLVASLRATALASTYAYRAMRRKDRIL